MENPQIRKRGGKGEEHWISYALNRNTQGFSIQSDKKIKMTELLTQFGGKGDGTTSNTLAKYDFSGGFEGNIVTHGGTSQADAKKNAEHKKAIEKNQNQSNQPNQVNGKQIHLTLGGEGLKGNFENKGYYGSFLDYSSLTFGEGAILDGNVNHNINNQHNPDSWAAPKGVGLLTIAFEGDKGGNTITGDVKNGYGETLIIFLGDGKIGGVIEANQFATNKVDFKKSGLVQGDIKASGDSNSGKNILSFAEGGSINGNITNTENGSSEINLNSSTLTLNGDAMITSFTFTDKNANGATLLLNKQGGKYEIKTLSGTSQTISFGAKEQTLTLGGTEQSNGYTTTENLTLKLLDNSSATLTNKLITATGKSTNIDFEGNSTLNANFAPQSNATLTIQAHRNSSATLVGDLDATHGKTQVLLQEGSSLALTGGTSNKLEVNELGGAGKIDLARVGADGFTPLEKRTKGKILTIKGGSAGEKGFKQSVEFEVFVDKNGSKTDKVVFEKATKSDNGNGAKATATITAAGDLDTILNADGQSIQVAEIGEDAKKSMTIKGGKRVIAGALIQTELVKESDTSNGDKYFLGKGTDLGTPKEYQDVFASALMSGYDLFLANFNSLNKRMGELRENPHGQGVWARVFGGAMSSEYGSGSKTSYVTAQAGYDYSFGFSEARNYLGIALAYGKSWTKGDALSLSYAGAPSSIALHNSDSSLVEVGIYNSYVTDAGWYNDTILKFDYIMSEFSLSDHRDLKSQTNNFAFLLGDEVGYRYAFGEEKDWSITPQYEIALGYLNQSNFNRAMRNTQGAYQNTFSANQDAILTLRNRLGGVLGKKFTLTQSTIGIYLGAFYEYDYIAGGNTTLQARTGGKKNTLDPLSSNGRAILNVGSNISLGESTRLYIDVEKSFGNKQRTFLQFNAGVRYSFGEDNGYTKALLEEETQTPDAPLKPQSY